MISSLLCSSAFLSLAELEVFRFAIYAIMNSKGTYFKMTAMSNYCQCLNSNHAEYVILAC